MLNNPWCAFKGGQVGETLKEPRIRRSANQPRAGAQPEWQFQSEQNVQMQKFEARTDNQWFTFRRQRTLASSRLGKTNSTDVVPDIRHFL
jgi:hypothetical protein